MNDTNEEEYVQPERVPVKGPLFCKVHGRDVKFIFDYRTKTYHHAIYHKNGAISICPSPVELKRW